MICNFAIPRGKMTIPQKNLNKQRWQAGTPPDSASAGLKSGRRVEGAPPPLYRGDLTRPTSKHTQIFKKTYHTHTVI